MMAEAAPVRKVLAKVDGRLVRVGLDTYAGCGMVLASLVEQRKAEWRRTHVVLEGVASELVTPLGEVDVSVQIGGKAFMESTLIVEHLPGDVEALVSFDTLQTVGLQVARDRTTMGGQQVELAGAVVPREGTVRVSAAASVKVGEDPQVETRGSSSQLCGAAGAKEKTEKLLADPEANAGV